MRFFILLFRRFFWPTILIGVLVVAGLIFTAGRWSVYRVHPELSQTEQAQALLEKVGTLIQLPTSETPTMASINDAASAKQAQPFLANAQNGDVLIVYAQAGEAILYRPSTNKLVAVGPVDNSPQNQTASPKKEIVPVATSTADDHATTTKK